MKQDMTIIDLIERLEKIIQDLVDEACKDCEVFISSEDK